MLINIGNLIDTNNNIPINFEKALTKKIEMIIKQIALISIKLDRLYK